MKKLVLITTQSILTIIALVSLSACSGGGYQNLHSINQSLGNAQRTVDSAKNVRNMPSADRKQILKNTGKAIMQQSPELQEAAETIRATKALAKSVKGLKQ